MSPVEMTKSNGGQRGPTNLLIPHTLGEGRSLTAATFPREQIFTVSYLTDRDQLSALLPAGIQILDEPILNFRYRYSEGLDWNLGGSHNAVGVSVPVKFQTKDEVLTGVHWLALWEDDAMAVALGREVFGVAKLYSDIHAQLDVHGEWIAMLSDAGHSIMRIEFTDPVPLKGQALEDIQNRAKKNAVIGWKQIPDVVGDKPLVSHPTYIPHVVRIEKAWSGVGDVTVFESDPKIHIWLHHVIEAIRGLPLLQCVGALMTEGSAELKVNEGRRLA